MPDILLHFAEVSATHSQLTGVLAGFALAGIFLLVERTQKSEEQSRIQAQYLRAMLLLFVAFLTGTISSYLYSSIVGDTPVRGFFLFQFPSAIFAIHTVVLLSGITVIFGASGVAGMLTLTRRITYIMVSFSVATIWRDLTNACEVFGLQRVIKISVSVFAIAPPAFSMILIFSQHNIQKRIKEKSFSAFCYTSTIVCLAIAYLHTVYRYVPDDAIELPFWMPLVLMLGVSVLGAWTLLLSPKRLAA